VRSAGKPNKTSRTRTATRGKSSRVAKVVRGGDLDAEKAVKQANCRRHSARPHRVGTGSVLAPAERYELDTDSLGGDPLLRRRKDQELMRPVH
jgi:hypothetical protein